MNEKRGWRIVQRQESWHVLDSSGSMLGAFPQRAEAQAWIAGVRYGIERTSGTYIEAVADIQSRMEGAKRFADQAKADTVGVGLDGVR